MKVKMDFSDYKPWSGAEDTYNIIYNADKLQDLEQLAEECLGDTVDQTDLNDFLWFESDFILKSLGIDGYQDDEDEEREDYYDENHAAEWMEKHPYGWYNSENDKGTGDEEDE